MSLFNAIKDFCYKRELEEQHRNLDAKTKTFLKPCEKCRKFLLLDFEICPLCKHQQNVDEIDQ